MIVILFRARKAKNLEKRSTGIMMTGASADSRDQDRRAGRIYRLALCQLHDTKRHTRLLVMIGGKRCRDGD